MNKTILENVIDDIKQLRGKDVYIFGQPTTLKNELDEFEIDVIDVLENLLGYEITNLEYEYYDEVKDDYIVKEFSNAFDYLDYLDEIGEIGYHNSNSDNSYNWSSPISNDINFTIYEKMDGYYIVECRVHRYGDVRTNYTDTFLLEFAYDSEFLEVLLESNLYKYIEIDGVTYDIVVDIFSDTVEINSLDGSYIGSVCAYDVDELKSEIKYLVD